MTRDFRLLPEPSRHILIPYDKREGMSVAAAADLAGYSPAHVRRLIARWDLGRHLGRGTWRVSRVAWRLFLDNDGEGLRAYHEGRRDHPSVRAAFAAIGISVDDGSRQRLIAAPAG